MELRSKVLNPDKASTVGDVEKKVAKWKEDVARLVGLSAGAVDEKDCYPAFLVDHARGGAGPA